MGWGLKLGLGLRVSLESRGWSEYGGVMVSGGMVGEASAVVWWCGKLLRWGKGWGREGKGERVGERCMFLVVGRWYDGVRVQWEGEGCWGRVGEVVAARVGHW